MSLMIFFHDFVHVKVPRARADNLLLLPFVNSIFFVKFHNDTPNSKGTREQKPFFCTLGAGADNSTGVNFEHHRKLLSL